MAKLTDSRCHEGETLTASFVADAAGSVFVKLTGDSDSVQVEAQPCNAAGVFEWKASPDDLSTVGTGSVRWVAFARLADGDVEAIADGRIYVRPATSKYRAVVEAIQTAIENWAGNANQTVTCGEISITAKSITDLRTALDYYRAKMNADEAGVSSVGGPRLIRTKFGR